LLVKENKTMASKESEVVRDHWRSMTEAARANPNQSPGDVRDRFERHLSGLPPTYIQVGAENARKAGVDAKVEVFPGQLHTFQMAAGHVPESDDAIRKFAVWVRRELGLVQGALT